MKQRLVYGCFLVLVIYMNFIPTSVFAFQSDKPNEVISGGRNLFGQAQSILQDGRLMVTGGEQFRGNIGTCGTVFTNFYDFETKKWTRGSDLPKRLYNHAQVTLHDGRVLVTGGEHMGKNSGLGYECEFPHDETSSRTYYSHNTSYIYDPKTDKWTTARNTPKPVHQHDMYTLENGNVLLIGGYEWKVIRGEAEWENVEAWWVYNPITNTWNTNPSEIKPPKQYSDYQTVSQAEFMQFLDGTLLNVNSQHTWKSNIDITTWNSISKFTRTVKHYFTPLKNDNAYGLPWSNDQNATMYSQLEDRWLDVNGRPVDANEDYQNIRSFRLTSVPDGRLALFGGEVGSTGINNKLYLFSPTAFPELQITPKLGQEISHSNNKLDLYDTKEISRTTSSDLGVELALYYRINNLEAKKVHPTKKLTANGAWQDLPIEWSSVTFTNEEIEQLNLGTNTVEIWVENNYNAKSTIQSFEFTTPIKDKPISDLSPGQTIDFGGREWIVLDPKTGYIVSKLPINDLTGQPRMMPFDTGGVNLYDPDREQNIAHYLNNEFYDNFTDIEKKVIVDRNWNLTHQDRTNRSGVNDRRDYVSAKVGLLQLDDWIVYSKRFNASRGVLANPPKNVWTLTPRTNYSNQQYYITTAGATSTSSVTSATGAILPAMYIYPNTSLAGITSGGSFIINDSNYKDGAKLANTKAGDYVTFGDEDWIVLDPGSGYMVKKQPIFNEDGTYHITPFDSANRNNFDPNKENTLAYYLNHEYLNTFTELEKESIAKAHWNIADNQRTGNTSTPNDYIAAKIGLLTNDDWIAYSNHYNANGRGVLENQPHDFWLLTPYTGNSTRNWYAGANGILNYQTSNSNIPMTLPAIHLKSNLFIASGNGSEDDPYELSLEQQARIVVENQSEKQVVSENSLVRLKVSVEGAPSAPISYQVYKNSKEQPVSCASCSGSGTGEINERILMIEPTQFEEGSTIIIQFLAEGAGIGGANIQKEIKLKVDSTGQFDPSDL